MSEIRRRSSVDAAQCPPDRSASRRVPRRRRHRLL